MFIKDSRLRTIWQWLAEARYAFLSMAIIFVALVISLRPHTTEPVIRLTGLVLQLLGIATVIWGIYETRALFGHPSFAIKTKAWLSRFPLLRRKDVIVEMSATLPGLTGKFRGYVLHKPKEPTIEGHLEALEKNITLLYEGIIQTQNKMDEEFKEITNALKREEHSRQVEDSTIREKLEATGIGGVHISAIGASWLFVGIILITAAIEIAEFLK